MFKKRENYRYQYTEKHSCFKLDSKQLIIFSSFLLKLKQIQCVYFMIQIRIFFSIFFSGRGGGGVSLTVKSCQVLFPFHCGNKIRTQNLQLATMVFSLSPTASSFQCLIQKAQNKISRFLCYGFGLFLVWFFSFRFFLMLRQKADSIFKWGQLAQNQTAYACSQMLIPLKRIFGCGQSKMLKLFVPLYLFK